MTFFSFYETLSEYKEVANDTPLRFTSFSDSPWNILELCESTAL